MVEISGINAQAFQITGIALIALLIVTAIGLLILWMYKQLQYKIPVTIHKVLGDNTIVEYYDKAKKISKNDQNELKLKKFKEIVPNPPNDYYLKTKGSERLYFRWDGGHVFVAQKLSYNSPLVFESAKYNILTQMAWRIKTSNERHRSKGFWQEYGAIVMWVGVIMISAITLWVMFSNMEGFTGAVNNQASAVKDMAEAVRGFSGQGQQVVG